MKRPVNIIVGFLAVAFLAASPAFSQVATGGGQTVIQPALAPPEQKLPCPANFITCLALSPDGKTVAVGTEDHGLLIGRLSKTGQPRSWQTFNRHSGASFRSNNIYSVCFDSQSRLWAGTLRSGVEVGFCKKGQWLWRDYDVVPNVPAARNPNDPASAGQNYAFSGPLGSHVYAIAENPKDRSMWLATEVGLAIYVPRVHSRHPGQLPLAPPSMFPTGAVGSTAQLQTFGQWRYITTANGLPPSPPDSLAFLPNGRVIVGTQCGGICMAGPQDHYRHWRIIRGPGRMPVISYGRGIPSGLINAVATAGSRHVYVATDSGLAVSANGGNTFRYERGADFAAKVQGLQFPPPNWQSPSKSALRKLLPEDYVTTLAMRGHWLWLGFRQQGFMAISTVTQAQFHSADSPALAKTARYVTAILPLPGNKILLGHYGKGLSELALAHPRQNTLRHGLQTSPKVTPVAEPVAKTDMPMRFPAAAPVPIRKQLFVLFRQLCSVPIRIHPSANRVVPLPPDWRTEGTWIDHVGNYHAILCNQNGGAAGGIDAAGGYAERLGENAWIGDHHYKGDFCRYWTQWKHTSKTRCLQNLYAGGRTESEWDDHGEAYSMDWQGPNLYSTLCILPAGQYVLALYFVNKDGHGGFNRYRDYCVRARPTAIPWKVLKSLGNRGTHAQKWFDAARPSAEDRVVNFWRGVYVRFYINIASNEGPTDKFTNYGTQIPPAVPPHSRGEITSEIARNYSFNAIISGVFIYPINGLRRDNAYVPGNVRVWPPVHKPAYHRRSIKATASRSKLACAILDRLIALRGLDSEWFEVDGRPAMTTFVRAILGPGSKGFTCVAQQINRSGKYQHFRRDVSRCLTPLDLFRLRDKVYFGQTKMYQSYAWYRRTQIRPWRMDDGWVWHDSIGYHKFLAAHQAKLTW